MRKVIKSIIKKKKGKQFMILKKVENSKVKTPNIEQSLNNATVLQLYQEKNIKEIMSIAHDVVPSSETIYVALKGAFKEYLFCTDKMVYIAKKGFMTGHTFGSGVFKMPYANITNAEVDYHLTTGYFELSSGGLQNKSLSYWSSKKEDSVKQAPNAISLAGKDLRDQFEQAAHFIMDKVATSHVSMLTPPPFIEKNSEPSIADKIREFKALADDGIISQEEFEEAKKQLLGL